MMEQFDSMGGGGGGGRVTRTFFYMMEQFVSMGVLGHFSLSLYLCKDMHLLLLRYLAMKHEIPASSESRCLL